MSIKDAIEQAKETRQEVREFREELKDFLGKMRRAKKGGFSSEEKAMLKAEFIEVVREGGGALGASAALLQEVGEALEKGL